MFHINFPRDWSKKTPKDEAEVDEKIIYLKTRLEETKETIELVIEENKELKKKELKKRLEETEKKTAEMYRQIALEKEKKRKYDELIAYQEKIFDETLAFAMKKKKTVKEEEEMERKIVEMEEVTETFLNKYEQ